MRSIFHVYLVKVRMVFTCLTVVTSVMTMGCGQASRPTASTEPVESGTAEVGPSKSGPDATTSDCRLVVLRLGPGERLLESLEQVIFDRKLTAAFVIMCVGSLRSAQLRFADCPEYTSLEGPWEIVSLVGTLGPDGAHIHATLSDRDGRTVGGHLGRDAIVYTTAEVVLGVATELTFLRPIDAQTGYRELRILPTVPDWNRNR